MSRTISIIIFYCITIFEFGMYIPQIIKLIKTKSSDDISILSQTINLIMQFGWLTYWVLTNVTIGQLIVSFGIICEVIVQYILVLIYRRK